MSEKRKKKRRSPWTEIGSTFGPFAAGVGLLLCLAHLMRRTPDIADFLITAGYLLASVPLLAQATKRQAKGWQLFAGISVGFGFVMFFSVGSRIMDRMTFFGAPGGFWVIGVIIGLLGGAICLWIIDLEWRYGRSKERKSIWVALLATALIAVGSAGAGIEFLSCANILLDHASYQQTTAAVEDLQEEYHIGGRYGSSYYTYHVTVSANELTGPSARLNADRQTYEALTVGDQVQLLLHPGALGAPWLECLPLEE